MHLIKLSFIGKSTNKIIDPSKIPFISVKKETNTKLSKETLPENKDIDDKNKTKEEGGIKILRDNACIDIKGHNMICGTIENTMNKPAKNVIIKIELFDENKNFIAFTEAKIYNLEANTKFDFQAPIFYKTASDYKIIKISSD